MGDSCLVGQAAGGTVPAAGDAVGKDRLEGLAAELVKDGGDDGQVTEVGPSRGRGRLEVEQGLGIVTSAAEARVRHQLL
jgi:hypothetical protein